MPTYEADALIRTKDESGNRTIHYPITKAENVTVPAALAEAAGAADETAAGVLAALAEKAGDNSRHLTEAERTAWNAKSGKAEAFTVRLAAGDWSGGGQTVGDSRILKAGYTYTVAPDGGSFEAYGKAVIRAENVSADGRMVFRCGKAPERDLTVNILRVESKGDGLVLNTGGGGAGSGIALGALTVTTPPAKISYLAGESFNAAGMVVEAAYMFGAATIATAAVSGYEVSPSVLTGGTTEVTITYTEDGVTVSTTLPVIVGNQPDNTFANNSWETIIAACHRGSVPSNWAVGDSKVMTIDGTDYQIDIIGKNHDDYADGGGKAPLTFQVHNIYNKFPPMNKENTSVGGWKECEMRKTHLPAILARMPGAVQAGIREVNKRTSEGNLSKTIVTTADKLFPLSECEVFGSTTRSPTGEGGQYAYYAASNSRVKTDITSGKGANWRLRSPDIVTNGYFLIVFYEGSLGNGPAGAGQSPTFAFCF